MTCFPGLFRSAVLTAVVLLAPSLSAVRAADVETRDFSVFVDDKAGGGARMIIQKTDDGGFNVRCGTDIRVTIGGLIKAYSYSYRGRETWKGGRLVALESTCTDDGKHFAVTARVDADGLRVRVNNVERKTRADVWVTSYWQQPDAGKVNQMIPLLDADTGNDLSARVEYVGEAQMNVAGQVQTVHHYRLTGKVQTNLWYDAAGRLVRQEWMETGHRVLLTLSSIRR